MNQFLDQIIMGALAGGAMFLAYTAGYLSGAKAASKKWPKEMRSLLK